MKKLSNVLFSQLTRKELNVLTTVIDETIATEFSFKENKVFTPADMWNIHRNLKSRITRRYL